MTEIDETALLEKKKQVRPLAASLDALVKTAKQAEQHVIPIATRVIETWHEVGDVPFDVSPKALLVDDIVALEADKERGRWILPAFMSGLRYIEPLPDTGIKEIKNLAIHISTLIANWVAMAEFRDWLWAGGATGFKVKTHMSFAEVAEAVEAQQVLEDNPNFAMAVRLEAAGAMGSDVIHIASDDLDAAALRQEFDVPIELFTSQSRQGSFSITEGERTSLCADCEDAARWERIEMEVAIVVPQLRENVPAVKLARQIKKHLTRHSGGAILRILAEVQERGNEYAKEFMAELDSTETGSTVAMTSPITDAKSVEQLKILLSGGAMDLATGLARGLLGRVAADRATGRYVMELIKQMGVPAYAKFIDYSIMPGEVVEFYATALINAKAAPRDIRPFLDALSDDSVAVVIPIFPPKWLRYLTPRLRALLEGDSPKAAGVIILALLKAPNPETLKLLGDIIAEKGTVSWRGSDVEAVCKELARNELGREYVVPMVRSRRASQKMRLAALRSLTGHPELLDLSSRWRLGELLDPREVRAALRRVRKHIRDWKKRIA